ncbi:MAG TPA: BTAD domain-containing putative transcriptional regulator [Candidatus Dormibacteraeota bacterium]|nr:BTAD domain-containing putative transcriptional regulator [Candidatus Dormibacteraeota bacterium]
MLAILLLNANKVIASERLIKLIWGEDPPDTASNVLQVYVSQLRKLVEPLTRTAPYRRLVSQAPGYVLRVDADQLDLDRFDLLVQQGQQTIARDPEVAARKLRQALELWRGPAFEDVGDSPFAVAERARFNEKRMAALESRVDAELALGRHRDLVGELQALVAEHPLRERLCGQLMLAFYRSGRQAEASNVYYGTRRRLIDELGMEPSVALQGLLKDILTQAPRAGWVTSEPGAAGTASTVVGPCPVLKFSTIEIPITLPKCLLGRRSRDGGGRPDVDLSGLDPQRSVSRRHAELIYRDDTIHVQDLGSANGTTVNGRRLAPNESCSLRSGDSLTFGSTSAVFSLPDGFVWRDWLEATIIQEVQA